MVEEHRERGRSATACWHACPLCHTRRLTSAPDAPPGALSTVPEPADEDAAYAAESALTGIDLEA